MIILCIFNINYILLEISGSHSNIISDSYIFHYGNELVSRTGNKEIRHFVTTNYDQKYPFAHTKCEEWLLDTKRGESIYFNWNFLSKFMDSVLVFSQQDTLALWWCAIPKPKKNWSRVLEIENRIEPKLKNPNRPSTVCKAKINWRVLCRAALCRLSTVPLNIHMTLCRGYCVVSSAAI